MRILLYHPVLLPPKDYGGVERVVLWLSEGLRDLGHSVSVACLPGSRLPSGVTHVPVDLDLPVVSISSLDQYDLVHFHSPPAEVASFSFPYLVTIHGNGKPGERFHPNTVFLSDDHARRHGRESYVFNGVNPNEFHFQKRKSHSARPLFLSKTSWKVKNLAAAMRICSRAGTGLTIAGGNRPLHLCLKSYFQGFEWAGPVAGELKARLLTEASCLIFPVQWPEPFGLVMVESMLSGTPVIGSNVGSIPEVLGVARSSREGDQRAGDERPRSSGVTVSQGGIVLPLEDEERWVEALREAKFPECEAVRGYALNHFTHLHMAENYVHVYKKAIRGEKIS